MSDSLFRDENYLCRDEDYLWAVDSGMSGEIVTEGSPLRRFRCSSIRPVESRAAGVALLTDTWPRFYDAALANGGQPPNPEPPLWALLRRLPYGAPTGWEMWEVVPPQEWAVAWNWKWFDA